jgi:hypothetical protein
LDYQDWEELYLLAETKIEIRILSGKDLEIKNNRVDSSFAALQSMLVTTVTAG